MSYLAPVFPGVNSYASWVCVTRAVSVLGVQQKMLTDNFAVNILVATTWILFKIGTGVPQGG